MPHHPESADRHPKHDFQVERLAFFSDAVFAIAITLMVIEFKVPHVTKTSTYEEIFSQLTGLRYEFMATLLSFLLIAVYWVRHHMLFKYIHSYNRPVLICSLFVLLPLIFFPFTTAFYAQSVSNFIVWQMAAQLFLFNNIIAGAATYVLYWLVTKKYPEMSYPMPERDKRVFDIRLVWMILIMTGMLIMVSISVTLIFYGVIPGVLFGMYKKFFSRKKAGTSHAR